MPRPLVKLVEVITSWIRSKPLEGGQIPGESRSFDRRPADEVLFPIIRVGILHDTERRIGCRRVRVSAGPETEVYASLVPFPDVVAERNVQLPLDPLILGAVPLHEAEEGSVRGPMTEDRAHLVALSQVVPRGPKALVQLQVVGVEDRV